MRILHTSDWHIGRQFHNVSMLDDQQFVLDQIVSIVETEKVDVVLIAGDVYDRAIPPAAAVSLVDTVLFRICNELDVPVIMIAGNHDGPERLGFASRQLAKANLHVIGPLSNSIDPVVLHDEYGDVLFYPLPYADPATVRNVFQQENADTLRTHDQCMVHLVQQIPKSDTRTAVLSHCFLAGASECESERPLSVGGADQVAASHFERFHYAALGHLHQRQKRGKDTIQYSGSILKYSFSEANHHKSVTLVDMDAAGVCQLKYIDLKARRDMRCISGELETILSQAKDDPNKDDYLLVSLTDTHAILDPMGKLREVYPNVLHLERPGLMASGENKQAKRELLKKGEMSMFHDFYQQIQGESLSDEQEKLMSQLIDELHQHEDHQQGS